MELKPTEHAYYCSDTNYHVCGIDNHGHVKFETWEDFKGDWLGEDLYLDDDYNHLFRFDIHHQYDNENDKELPGFMMELFFILQRKGNFVPISIGEITQDDMPEINAFLSKRWEYMKGQWSEFAL